MDKSYGRFVKLALTPDICSSAIGRPVQKLIFKMIVQLSIAPIYRAQDK